MLGLLGWAAHTSNHAELTMEDIGPCLEWKGAKNSHGYAYTSVKSRAVRANRFFWEKAHGKIPDGLYVLHKCDNRACVNVDHLFLGTHQDNMDDMARKGRNPRSYKIKSSDVIAIRGAFQNGETQRSLADRFNLSEDHVQRICAKKSWKQI